MSVKLKIAECGGGDFIAFALVEDNAYGDAEPLAGDSDGNEPQNIATGISFLNFL